MLASQGEISSSPDAPSARESDGALSLVYTDLGARVLPVGVPDELAKEVESLYGNRYSTLDYIEVFDDLRPTGAVILERPRHVLLFAVRGRTIEVLTRRMSIAPQDARRAVRALLRAFPSTTRVHLEVLFPPHDLGVPTRILHSADDMVIALPADLDSYVASLGASTRRNLRTYENRLRRAFPDASTEILEAGERAADLFDVYLDWKRPRLAAQGTSVYFDVLPDRKRRFVELLRRRGEAHITTAGGRTVAVVFTFPVGPGCCLAQYAYDPDLSYYHLGLLTQYWTIADAISRGMRQMSLLPGTSYYKERLGALPERGTHLSVFPSQFARLYSAGEAWEVGRRRLRERSSRTYWGARHRARALAGSLRSRAGGGESG